jgi:hypothetical protein
MSDDVADDFVDAERLKELWYGPATKRGKTAALAALAERRERFKDDKPVDNASLPAGSPMFYQCIGCGAPIVMHEGWITKPDCCVECEALRRLGWLE